MLISLTELWADEYFTKFSILALYCDNQSVCGCVRMRVCVRECVFNVWINLFSLGGNG